MTSAPLGDQQEVSAVLREIVAAYGTEGLSDPATMTSYLADVFPNSPQITRALIAAAEDKVASTLLDRVGHGVDAGTAARLVASAFAVTSMFQPEICAWTVGVIATALDLTERPPTIVVAPPWAEAAQLPVTSARNAHGAELPPTAVPQAAGRIPDPRQVQAPRPAQPAGGSVPAREPVPVHRQRAPGLTPGTPIGQLSRAPETTDLVFSPADDRVVTVNSDAKIRLWDGSGNEIAGLRHDRAVAGMALSPDGTRLVSRLRAPAIGTNRLAILWDATAGGEISRLEHFASVTSVRFSADGSRIATVSDEKIARLWSPDGQEMARLPHDKLVTAAGFSKDSKRLIALCLSSSNATLWDVTTGQRVAPVTHGEILTATAFSPDSSRLVSYSTDGVTRLWDSASGQLAPWLERMDAWAIAFSPDSKVLATASADRAVRLWNPYSAQLIGLLPHVRMVTALACSPDSEYLATASGTMAQVWQIASCKETLRTRDDHDVTSIAFNAAGTRLVTTNSAGTIRLWDTTSGQELIRTQHGSSRVARFSPDGRQLITAGTDKFAQLWEATTGRLLARLPHSSAVTWATFSPDSVQLATRDGKAARLWST
jgi:WD40 repeat protein